MRIEHVALGEGWEPVPRSTTYELVLGQIQSQIQTGRLRAGDRLPSERDLAQALGVSRVAVREAVGVLKAFGVARTAPGSGAEAGTFLDAAPADALARLIEMHVLLASVSTRDVVRARIALERESARLAANHARARDWAEMNAELEAMALPRCDVAQFNAHDSAFHVAIARASGNPLVAELTTALRHAMRLTLLARLSAAPDFALIQRRLCGEHEGIYAALRDGDGARAADLVESHIRDFYAEPGRRP
ncbi:MAG: FCD domain-containing protein [Candidatus Phosphoribacter sp.]|nr:FadR family transcriptional regulator [Actinomycetales bacterium]